MPNKRLPPNRLILPPKKRRAIGLQAALIKAVNDCNVSAVREAIAAGADINRVDEDGCTALMWAAESGEVEVVRALIAAKAVLDFADTKNATALMWAAEQGHIEVVRELLAAGASVYDTVNSKKCTALKWAVEGGHTEVVQALVDARAEVNYVDSDGRTVLMHAARIGELDVVCALLGTRVKINHADYDGITALMWAIEGNHVEIVKTLVLAGADINLKDIQECTALMRAAAHGHTRVVQTLLDVCASQSLDVEVNQAQISFLLGLYQNKLNPNILTSVIRVLHRFNNLVEKLSPVENAMVSLPIIHSILEENAVIRIQPPHQNDKIITNLISSYIGGHEAALFSITETAREVQMLCQENERLRMQLAAQTREVNRLRNRLHAKVTEQHEAIKPHDNGRLTRSCVRLFSSRKHVESSQQIQPKVRSPSVNLD